MGMSQGAMLSDFMGSNLFFIQRRRNLPITQIYMNISYTVRPTASSIVKQQFKVSPSYITEREVTWMGCQQIQLRLRHFSFLKRTRLVPAIHCPVPVLPSSSPYVLCLREIATDSWGDHNKNDMFFWKRNLAITDRPGQAFSCSMGLWVFVFLNEVL